MSSRPPRAGDAGRGPRRRVPPHLVLGGFLVAGAWALNHALSGVRTAYLFFPLWLGYALVVDGLALRLRGDSILSRSPRGFGLLFLVSCPVWWLFELANLRLRNWEYLGREEFSDLAYAFWCTVSFSTVMPAVLGTAELVRGARWVETLPPGPRIRPTPRLLRASFVAGLVSLAAMLAWPRVGFPLLWVSGVLLLEPACRWVGRPGLLGSLARGDWRPVLSLALGVLVCAFFWEMWNAASWPKWVYHVPWPSEPKLFEMPLAGYLGYPPFALELFLVADLVPGRTVRLRL